jgi:DNA-3-methyladenine glycosylase
MNKFKPLARSVFVPSAETVAPALLGHWLIRLTPRGAVGGPIVETEAYLSVDPACHAAPGLTPRNRVMFGPPGHAYVYFIYGCHYCVNAVCRPAGTAEAVLIRAIEAAFDCEAMKRARAVTGVHNLTNGPAKLCEAMGIGRLLNGVDLCDPRSPLLLAENPACKLFRRQRGPVVTTARIGITRAVDLPLRFYLNGSAFVSRRITKPERR